MKIVHIHHHYWPMVSGLENVARALAEGMVKLGHEVHVITSNYGTTNKTGKEEINGVHVYRIRSIRLGYPDLTYPLDYPTEVLKDADIVQAYSQNSLFTYILAKKGKRLGKTTSIYYLGVDYLRMHHNPIIRMIGYRYEKYVTEKLVKITDIALTTNKCETEVLKVNYGIESEIIQHGIDDVDALIRAFRRIYNKVEDVNLVIAGNGDERYVMKLRKLIKELGLGRYVYMLGRVSEEDKVGLINAAKFLVLMSRHAGESYPVIINETLARRKLIINRVRIA